jgi:hypothetical protein
MSVTALLRYCYITFLHYPITHQHCGENYRLFYSYCSKLMEIVIVSRSYRSGLIENVIAFISYRSENMTKAITCNSIKF